MYFKLVWKGFFLKEIFLELIFEARIGINRLKRGRTIQKEEMTCAKVLWQKEHAEQKGAGRR